MNIRNWLTRPMTPSEHARALSNTGHSAHRARVKAVAAVMREQTKLGLTAPLGRKES